jgi:hypothetical protein
LIPAVHCLWMDKGCPGYGPPKFEELHRGSVFLKRV